MKDIMTITGSSNNHPPKEFKEYLHTLIKDIVVKEEKFNKYKKWLEKYCIEVDVNYNHIETEIKDFIDLFEDEQTEKNTTFRKILYKTGENIFLTSEQIDDFYSKRRETLKNQKQFEQQQENILKAEIPQKVNDFVKKHKGEWNSFDWLDFKVEILNDFADHINERRLTEITAEKHKEFIQKQNNLENQQQKKDYENAVKIKTIESFNVFIKKHKEGGFVNKAKKQIEKINEAIKEIKTKEKKLRGKDYEAAKKTNTIIAYTVFINKYKDGELIYQAKQNIEKIKKEEEERKEKEHKKRQEDFHKAKRERQDFIEKTIEEERKRRELKKRAADFEEAKKINTVSAFTNFIYKYKEGELIYKAKQEIERIKKKKNESTIKKNRERREDFNIAKKKNSISSYENFIKKYKEGKLIYQANQNIISIKNKIEKRDRAKNAERKQEQIIENYEKRKEERDNRLFNEEIKLLKSQDIVPHKCPHCGFPVEPFIFSYLVILFFLFFLSLGIYIFNTYDLGWAWGIPSGLVIALIVLVFTQNIFYKKLTCKNCKKVYKEAKIEINDL